MHVFHFDLRRDPMAWSLSSVSVSISTTHGKFEYWWDVERNKQILILAI